MTISLSGLRLMPKRRVIDSLRHAHGGTWRYVPGWGWEQVETARCVLMFSSCMCDEPCKHRGTLRWMDTREAAL